MATTHLIKTTRKTPEAACRDIVKQINAWAERHGIEARATVCKNYSAPSFEVEDFGFESAVRFSLGEALYGDDYGPYSTGPGFDMDGSPYVYLECQNNCVCGVYETW